jgi:putative ABC transport system permease protein
LQLDKQRELGVLRAVGLTIRQLWRLVLFESGLLGASAGLLALPTGFGLALILIYIINRRAFDWTLQLHVEAAPFIEAFAVAYWRPWQPGSCPPGVSANRLRLKRCGVSKKYVTIESPEKRSGDSGKSII